MYLLELTNESHHQLQPPSVRQFLEALLLLYMQLIQSCNDICNKPDIAAGGAQLLSVTPCPSHPQPQLDTLSCFQHRQ